MFMKEISDYPDITFLLEKDRDIRLLRHNYEYFVTPDTKRRFNEIMLGVGSYIDFAQHLKKEYDVESILVLMPFRMSEYIKEYSLMNIMYQEKYHRAFNFNVAYHT